MVNQPSRADLDHQIRQVHNGLRTALDNLAELKRFIDGFTAEQLIELFNFTQADVDNLKAMVVQHPAIVATTPQPTPMADALTFGGRLAGVNFVRR